VNAVVEKELSSKTPDDLAKSLEKIGMGDVDRDQMIDKLRDNGKAAIIPVLAELLGPKATLGVIETIIFSLTAKIIGRQAARQLLKTVMKRNPWLNSLGPILWVISGVWITVNLQGPAYRKTVPACLYLGLVGLRDGEEDLKDL
jgi:uncharacterized protein YaaW (UPF0174 family)